MELKQGRTTKGIMMVGDVVVAIERFEVLRRDGDGIDPAELVQLDDLARRARDAREEARRLLRLEEAAYSQFLQLRDEREKAGEESQRAEDRLLALLFPPKPAAGFAVNAAGEAAPTRPR